MFSATGREEFALVVVRNFRSPRYVVRWKHQQDNQTAAGRPAFTGRGIPALSPQEARLKELERELDIARQERDILKKALAFFAKQP